MKLSSRLTARTAVLLIVVGFACACAVSLLTAPAAKAGDFFFFDSEGKYKFDCPASQIDLTAFSYADGKTSYTFSGHCSQSSDDEALPNFPYTITGSWSEIGHLTTEVISSSYGTYSKRGLCKHDPWLEPTVSCQTEPAKMSVSSQHFAGAVMTAMVNKIEAYPFPYSKKPIEPERSEVLKKLLNQSLTIVQPQGNKAYDYPGQFTGRINTARLVSETVFPNLVAILQVDEQLKWPDPNDPARSFTLLSTVEHPGGNLYPRAEFPMGSTDLWDGSWAAKAHLLVADPFWTPAVPFSVGPSEKLGPPPEQIQPTVLSEIAETSKLLSMPRLFIMSPQAGQSVLGNVTLKVEVWGYPEATATTGPEITLDWSWKPFEKPNAPPPLPIPMEVRSKMHGTELVIPRSAFKGEGTWSVTATIKGSENKPISDQVTFKIRELSDAVGQVNLNTSAHTKISPKATVSTEKEQIKQPGSKIQALPAMSIKDRAKSEPKGQAQAIQQQAAPQVLAAFKTAPTIIRPQENERFAKPGPVQISARVSAADAGLVWDVEYQAFNAPTFIRQRQPSAGALAAGGGTVKMARLTFPAPGTYRFRAKEEGDQARWSPWRTIVVGSPPALTPAARNIKLNSKPELSTKPQLQSDAVKAAPVAEEAPAAAPIRQVPTGVAPSAIKPNAVPKIKPLP